MKDIKNNEIASGSKVHIFGISKKDESAIDINAIVVATRGRGVKFIDEVSGKEYTKDFIEEHSYNILVTNAQKKESTENQAINFKNVSEQELELISKLKNLGWTGNLQKACSNGLKFSILLNNL